MSDFIRRDVVYRRRLAAGWELKLSCGHKLNHPAKGAGAKVKRVVCWECEKASPSPHWLRAL